MAHGSVEGRQVCTARLGPFRRRAVSIPNFPNTHFHDLPPRVEAGSAAFGFVLIRKSKTQCASSFLRMATDDLLFIATRGTFPGLHFSFEILDD